MRWLLLLSLLLTGCNVSLPGRGAVSSPAPRPTATVKPAEGVSSGATAPAVVDLRTVNWEQIITNEPGIQHPRRPDFAPANAGPYVEANGDGGFALLSNIVFGDFSGDGAIEAVIPCDSGGTGGTFLALVYAPGPGGPVFVGPINGYKLGLSIANGALVVKQPLYADWNANCCPSGISEATYTLQGATLRQTGIKEDGLPEMRKPTVEEFYRLLNDKQYQQAYNFLSPAFQAANPYSSWSAGYQNTVSIQATVGNPTDTVPITLVATERGASGNVTRRFTGSWRVTWSAQRMQWVLDSAQITEQR